MRNVGIAVLVVAAACVLPVMASAKSGAAGFVVKGRVTDATTDEPIAGARIGDDGYAGGKQWTTSDANGYYSYMTWYEEHNIKCSAEGYAEQKNVLLTKVKGGEKERKLDFVLISEIPADVLKACEGKTAEDVGDQCILAMNKREYKRSRQFGAVAVQMKPDLAEGWIACGMASVKLKDYAYAKKCYETALGLYERSYEKKQNASDIQQRVFVLMLLNREKDAAALLDSGMKRFGVDKELKLLRERGLSVFAEAKKEYGLPGE